MVRAYNVDMANLPARTLESSVPEHFADHLVDQIAKGVHPREMAAAMYPDRADRGKRLNLYRKLKRIALGDERVAKGIADDARLDLMVALGPAVAGLRERAARGRPDAVKIVLEATGFHNPRVKHEHSGEINVKIDMPRPTHDADVTDAEVVD